MSSNSGNHHFRSLYILKVLEHSKAVLRICPGSRIIPWLLTQVDEFNKKMYASKRALFK